MSLITKIFIGLFLGIFVGYCLNLLGGKEHVHINEYIFPFLAFVGNLFIRCIRMVVVPLVFFCIIDAAISLGDIKKLRTIGLKNDLLFPGQRHDCGDNWPDCRQYYQAGYRN